MLRILFFCRSVLEIDANAPFKSAWHGWIVRSDECVVGNSTVEHVIHHDKETAVFQVAVDVSVENREVSTLNLVLHAELLCRGIVIGSIVAGIVVARYTELCVQSACNFESER